MEYGLEEQRLAAGGQVQRGRHRQAGKMCVCFIPAGMVSK